VKRFLLYCIGGTLAVAVHYATLILLVEFAGWREVYASMAGFLAAVPVNFSFQRFIVFKTLDDLNIRLRRYFIVTSGTFVLNACIFYVAVDIAQIPYLIGQAITIILIVLVNYWLNTAWTFKPKTSTR